MHQIKNCCFFQNYTVGRYRLDFAYPEEKRAVEIDGKQHLEERAIEHDRIRDEWLKSQGWIILRIPAQDLKNFLKNVMKEK
ncbi:MAG: DUF559 domain-containing protein [Nanoarchaeota archaeon]